MEQEGREGVEEHHAREPRQKAVVEIEACQKEKKKAWAAQIEFLRNREDIRQR